MHVQTSGADRVAPRASNPAGVSIAIDSVTASPNIIEVKWSVHKSTMGCVDEEVEVNIVSEAPGEVPIQRRIFYRTVCGSEPATGRARFVVDPSPNRRSVLITALTLNNVSEDQETVGVPAQGLTMPSLPLSPSHIASAATVGAGVVVFQEELGIEDWVPL